MLRIIGIEMLHLLRKLRDGFVDIFVPSGPRLYLGFRRLVYYLVRIVRCGGTRMAAMATGGKRMT